MESMLDARYWMLDNQQLTRSEFQKHRASRKQYPESVYVINGFHRVDL